ncbi:MAG: type IV pilus secretin PilQ [Nitrospiraceae bacterium]
MKRHTLLTAAIAFTLASGAVGVSAAEFLGRAQAHERAALSGVGIERLPDRVRVTVDGLDAADTYRVESSQVPPMVMVELNTANAAASGDMTVERAPITRILRDRLAQPHHGQRLVFQLRDHVKPEVTRTATGLHLDFPIAAEAMPAASTISAIQIHPMGDETNVVLSGNGRMNVDAHMASGNRLVLDLSGVTTTLKAPVAGAAASLVERVRVGRHADKVRFVLDLNAPAHYVVEPNATGLTVRVSKQAGDVAAAPADAAAEPVSVASSEARAMTVASTGTAPVAKVSRLTSAQPFGLAVKPQLAQMTSIPENSSNPDEVVVDQRHYVGRRLSLDFQAAEITNVLRLIADVSGFNIVVGEGVKAKVTMKIVNVPWDQALDMLLKMNGLGMIKQGNIVWVDTLSNIAKQQQEEANAKNSKAAAEELVTRIFYLRNVQAQEVMTSLRQYITSRGQMQSNAGSNALIVRDVESKIGVIKQMIDGLDIQVPQVEIEARVVQANTNYTRSLGIQWGLSNVNNLSSSNGVANFQAGTIGAFGKPESNWLVNLPATVAGLSPAPALGFQFGRTDGGGALLDLRLSAGEALGLTKVIASPKITTLDKRDAKISQGESIPFQTVSLQGTQTTFVDANLELQVTPQITSRDPNEVAKQIMMKVRATRNAVGARSNPAGPSIDKREANTQVLVRDGETMVIGGVYVDAQQNNVNGIPYLSRIPVLGWLFKNKLEDISRQELLIFLTPNIVKS